MPARYGLAMDPKVMLWNYQAPSPAKPKAGETLFRFVRASDGAEMSCGLRFHGESYGWEARFLEGGELFYSHGGFAMKELAIQWAWRERKAMEG